MAHNYGLDWIDEDKLFVVTKSTLKNAIKQSESSEKFKLPPDPFTLVAQAAMLNTSLSEAIDFEPARALNKSISNSIGLWHQHVLGLSDIWIDTGSNGGVADIRTSQPHPNFNKPLIVEVKNRYNTIKGVNEKDTWDNLESLARYGDK